MDARHDRLVDRFESPRGGLPEPRVPRQAQAQGMRHDNKFHDIVVHHLGQGAQRRFGRKGCDTLPRGRSGHDDLW
jgi:hypothetical protein